MIAGAAAVEQLDNMFFALADGNRRAILASLSEAPASVSELADPLGLALPSAVKHLAILERGGYVCSSKTGRVRTYTIDPRGFEAMQVWLERHKRQLNAQFERLGAYLAVHNKETAR